MTRVTLVAFALLTGFFYITGRPVTETGQMTNSFADLVNHEISSEQKSSDHTSKLLISNNKYLTVQAGSSTKRKDVPYRDIIKIKKPALPIRNPRRTTTPGVKYAKSAPSTAIATSDKTIRITKVTQTRAFQDGRNKFNNGTIKPLGLSYQQRYVKSQKPVLGPRLTAVLLKRELRRVGCYNGNVTSNWDDSARAAVAFFNTSTGSNLATKKALVSSLEKVQQITNTVCAEQPVIEGTLIASAGQAQNKGKASTRRIVKKTNKWRTNVQYRKASYRPAPAKAPQRRVKRTRTAQSYIAPPGRLVKPRRASRKSRLKRAKKIRIARKKARRRTAVRSWKKRYRRKRFGFRSTAGGVSLNH